MSKTSGSGKQASHCGKGSCAGKEPNSGKGLLHGGKESCGNGQQGQQKQPPSNIQTPNVSKQANISLVGTETTSGGGGGTPAAAGIPTPTIVASAPTTLELRPKKKTDGGGEIQHHTHNPFLFLQNPQIDWSLHPLASSFTAILHTYLNRRGYRDGVRIRRVGGGSSDGGGVASIGRGFNVGQQARYYFGGFGSSSQNWS